MHNYSEEKKMAVAALEFDDYALIWGSNCLVIEKILVKEM
jgi:hypothetical protein